MLVENKKNEMAEKATSSGQLERLMAEQVCEHGMQYQKKEDKEEYQLRQTTKWIVSANLPFSTVEQPEFRKMISTYSKEGDKFKKIDNKLLKTDLKMLNDKIRDLHIKSLEGMTICATLENWTPQNSSSNYVGMTVSWIDIDWNKRSCTLGLCLHEGDSQAKSILCAFLERSFPGRLL